MDSRGLCRFNKRQNNTPKIGVRPIVADFKKTSKISFCVAVWGRKFTDNFLNYSLNSLLEYNNIPSLSKKSRIKFKIYTTNSDLSYISQSVIISQLLQYAEIEYFLISGVNTLGNYISMNHCHRDFISRSKGDILFFICPDIIFSDGAIMKIYKKLSKKIKVVCIFTPRLNLETFLPKYKAALLQNDLRSLDSEALLRMSCDHFHSETKSMILDEELDETVYSGGYFYKKRSGLIGSQFHYFPVCIKHKGQLPLPDITVDNDYLGKLVNSIEEIYVFENAKDCCIIDISTEKSKGQFIKEKRSVKNVASWAVENTNRIHLDLFLKTYLFLEESPKLNSKIYYKVKKFRKAVLKEIESIRRRPSNHKPNSLVKRWSERVKNNTVKSAIFKIKRYIYLLIFKRLRIKEKSIQK